MCIRDRPQKGGTYNLVFTDGMTGRVSYKDDVLGFDQLKTASEVVKKSDGFHLPLNDSNRGKIIVDGLTILFQFVPPPPEPLGASMDFRPRFIDDDDPVYYGFLSVFWALGIVFGIITVNAPPRTPSVDELPDRFTQIISTPPAEDTPPPPEPSPAPPPPAPAASPKAVLIANASSGFEAPLADKHLKALFRGMVQSTPAGQRTLFYLMPAHSEAQNIALEEIMGWTESNFERQMPIIESQMARLMYKRTPGATEVIAAVANDPGGIGVVPGDLSLPPTVMVLWSSGGGE